MKTLLALIALAGLMSCTDSIIHEPPAADTERADLVGRPLGRMNFEGASLYEGDTESARAARLELLDGVMDRVGRVKSALRSGGSWNARYRAVRGILDAGDGSAAERWFVEQMTATLILESMIASGETGVQTASPDTWNDEAAAHSVEMLLRHGSPNAPLIAVALTRMKGYWAEDRIAAAAVTASANALHWLEWDCVECGRKSDEAAPAAVAGGIDAKTIRKGVVELERLAAVR